MNNVPLYSYYLLEEILFYYYPLLARSAHQNDMLHHYISDRVAHMTFDFNGIDNLCMKSKRCSFKESIYKKLLNCTCFYT